MRQIEGVRGDVTLVLGEPTVLSAFTGAGGIDLGLEHAGFSSIGCIDFSEDARRTIELNRPSWSILEPHDVTEFVRETEPGDLGLERRELDVLAGGPPCQPFSKAAQWTQNGRGGVEDERSNCIFSFLDLVNSFLPAVVLVENVRGFARGDTSAIPVLEDALDKINREHGTSYRLQVKTVNAADYGVPQKRKRSIIVALRDEQLFYWPEPTHDGKPVRAWDALAEIESDSPPELSGKWAELLPSVPEGENYQYHTPRGDGRDLFGYRTRFWSFLLKLAKDQPSWTIPAQPGPATGPFHWENRPLDVPERLRLQSFPADWKVAGDQRSKVNQVGNATPPLLVELIGRALGKQLFDAEYEEAPRLAIPRKPEVPPPEDTEPVPQHYIEDYEDDHDPHPGPGKGPAPVSTPPESE